MNYVDIYSVTEFFKWCTIINGGLLLVSSVLLMFIQDFAYNIHSRWLDISRKTYNKEIYHFLGIFKVIFICFNLTPYLAMLIISG